LTPDASTTSPLEPFEKFITAELQQRICDVTNERANDAKVLLQISETSMAYHPAIQKALKRSPWLEKEQSSPRKALKYWINLDREELKVWLGITLYMGLAVTPQISDYWSTDVI
jgi:hypothetical protein